MILNPLTAAGRLLDAMPARHRPQARLLLSNPRLGGRGLREWLALLDADGRPLPADLPPALVEVYLKDGEAEPLHDCAACGLAVPVRASRHCGHEAAEEHAYFPTCPHCGGRTGRHAYWARHATTR